MHYSLAQCYEISEICFYVIYTNNDRKIEFHEIAKIGFYSVIILNIGYQNMYSRNIIVKNNQYIFINKNIILLSASFYE